MTDEHHSIASITCTHCQQQQDVHLRARLGFRQVSDPFQTVVCVACKKPFEVRMPDDILAGPFMPEKSLAAAQRVGRTTAAKMLDEELRKKSASSCA
jgi:hypothetical protein